ncbi:MAG: antitoxin [Nitrospirales bacterium]|nr:antitoxin [Nitrospirales bacterium]
MQTKLTLRLEEDLIKKAKSYASHSGKSVSQLVSDYFRLLTSEKGNPQQQPAPPVTQSLRGILRNAKLDEKEYKKYLEEKHR